METPLLQPGDSVSQDSGGSQDRGQEPPPKLILSQHSIHEYAHDGRRGEGQHGQHQAASERIRQCSPGVAKPEQHTFQEVGGNASPLELRPGIELQDNAGKARTKLFRGELAAPRGRVVEIEGFSIIAFQDEKVAELPEHNKRKPQILDLADVHVQAFALKAIGLGGPYDAGGGGPVPADLALAAQFDERHPAPKMGEHAAKARSAALGGMRLQQEWSGDALLGLFPHGVLV